MKLALETDYPSFIVYVAKVSVIVFLLDTSTSVCKSCANACADPEGDRGSGPPEKSQSYHSILGQHRHASDTLFKGRFAGGPMMARL